MLVSLQQLARKMTDQFVSHIAKAGFNSFTGVSAASHKMETNTNTKHFTHATGNGHQYQRHASYEDAMKALQNLQSNAEIIAKARQNVNKRPVHNIPNMIKYIIRSGLSMEDVDKLSVIHVSGTKGKGSTCAFCERILHSRGYRTGLFTSPHMIEARERIRINGRPISQELFSHYFWRVYDSLQITQTEIGVGAEDGGGMPPYFAFLTVLSLHVFLSEGVDVAVVEVGIGGQFDSTNFFRKPVVCGVTSLGLDHTAILGTTITDIAWNKAGIFKPGRPAITVMHDRTALEVLLKRAQEIQNPLYLAVEMSRERIQRQNIKLGIAGAKQVENASLAIQLCRMWEQNHTSGKDMVQYPPTSASCLEEIPVLEVSDVDEATVKGLSSCVWPGRAQTVHSGGVTYYLDGAHTKESMEVCSQWFREVAEEDRKRHSWKKCARILLFNATSDRDVAPLLTYLTACNFDAALFCTNLLSVVESHNRADQVNKTVTVNHMLEKVDVNKSTWDELITKSKQNSKPTEDYTCFNGDTHPNGFVYLDHNFNKTDSVTTTEVKHITEAGYEHEISPVRKVKVPGQDSLVESSASNGLSEDEVARISKTTQSTHNHGTDSNSAIAQDCFAKDKKLLQPAPNGIVHFNNCLDCNSEASPTAVSMKFPCILHALAWATQGKDPLVSASDADSVALSIPDSLRNADHLQILVTGSLHLVGGVLGVVDPHMND